MVVAGGRGKGVVQEIIVLPKFARHARLILSGPGKSSWRDQNFCGSIFSYWLVVETPSLRWTISHLILLLPRPNCGIAFEMAPSKSPRSKDDKSKKRKRDVSDAAEALKRQRAQGASRSQGELGLTNGKSDDIHNALTHSFENEAGWRISRPMGGRMLDVDPILTDNDEYVLFSIARYVFANY